MVELASAPAHKLWPSLSNAPDAGSHSSCALQAEVVGMSDWFASVHLNRAGVLHFRFMAVPGMFTFRSPLLTRLMLKFISYQEYYEET